MGRAPILQAVCIHPLMSPRARDERCAKHRLLWSTSWMVAWASRLFVRSRPCFHGLSLGKKWKWLGHTHTETSRTRCVWGNTVVPELPSPPQRARPFHSQVVQTQASPFHLSRGVIRSITLFFWVGHLFPPFFIVWGVDCLFCRIPGPNQSFSSLAQGPS